MCEEKKDKIDYKGFDSELLYKQDDIYFLKERYDQNLLLLKKAPKDSQEYNRLMDEFSFINQKAKQLLHERLSK